MKKITFIFVGIIYVVAIIMVAFLGVRAEVVNQTVEVTSIVLKEAAELKAGENLVYPAGVEPKNSTYMLYCRPEEENIDISTGKSSSTGSVVWNSDTVRYNYAFQVRGLKTIYESATWRDGKGHFDLGAYVLPEDATKQELIYTVTDSSGAYPKELTVDNQGMLTFHAQITAKIAYYTVKIAATDNSMVASYVSFMVAGYK